MERMSRRTVVFVRPFRLSAVERLLPAGAYEIETREEVLQGVSFAAYRRCSTSVTLEDPASRMRQVTEIDPDDLAAALSKDLEDSNG